MTSPQAGGTDRDLRAPRGSSRAPFGIPAIAILLLAGLALRLIIAYVLFPGAGFKTDLSSFTSWSLTLADKGPGGFYANAGFADYTPGYLYVLWLVGLVAKNLAPVLGQDTTSLVEQLLKLPPMVIDVVVAYVLYRIVLAWGRDRHAPGPLRRAALIAAALYLFNPVTWYDSALWGQVDAIGALVMLAAVVALVDGHSEGASALTVVATLVKPQYGVVLGPVVAIVLLRRHVFLRGSGPRPSWRPRFLAGWLDEEQGWWRIVSSVTVALAVLVVMIVPFGLGIIDLVVKVVTTAGEYHYLTVNAYNGWALVGDQSLAAAGTWTDDLLPFLGPLPAVVVGGLLLAVGLIIGFVQVALRDDRRSIVLAITYLALAFFVLPTRVHERYLFPALVFLPLLAVTSRRWLAAAVVLAIVSFMNLHGVLTLPLYATPNIADLAFGPAFRSQAGVTIAAVGQMAIFAVALLALDPVRALAGWLRRRPVVRADPDLDPAWAVGDAHLTAGAGPPLARPSGAMSVPAAGAAFVRSGGAADEFEPGTPGPERAAPGLAGRLGPAWLRSGLALPSVRANRSASLASESGGRIDRLDVLVMALVLVAGLVSRTWRLEEPYGMHFDEVYHARTATEFLQDWRYGIPHDIYEFTHPHLAKYLIAAGIVAFGGDAATDSGQLGTPVSGVALEPRWSPADSPDQRDGDRLYVATGSEVRAYDLADRGLVATIGGGRPTAVAVDATSHLLYVGTADGRLLTVSTAALDDVRTRSGPLAGTAIAAASLGPAPVGSAAVTRLAVSDDGSAVLAAFADGSLASVDPSTGTVAGRAPPVAGAANRGVAGIAMLDPVERVMVDPAQVSNPTDLATKLAGAVGDTSGRIARLLAGATRKVSVAGWLTTAQRSAVDAIAAQEPAVSIASGLVVAVSGAGSLRFLDALTLDELATLPVDQAVGGLVLTTGIDKPRLYVADGPSLRMVDVASDAQPAQTSSMRMPGPVTDVVWDRASNLVHALGRTQDGASATVYVVEPHANSVFADARLPFTPTALALDQQPDRPASDRQQLLALGQDGAIAVVDAGSHAFAWRLPGVIAGALMIVCLYLLARLLWRRRSIALLVATFGLVDGMFFAQARIAMNDTYVAFFIVAGYTVFAALYLGRWRGWSALAVGLPLLGLLLGLALASKWVGAYAIGALVLLVLLRSALGRVIALIGMAGLSGILGNLAINGPADVQSPQTDPLFLVLMVVLTLVLAAAVVVRPVRWTPEELRLAVVGPLVLAILIGAGAVVLGNRLPAQGPLSLNWLLAAGFGLVVVAVAAYVVPGVLARFGMGPLARPPTPDEPRSLVAAPADAPQGWLLPGTLHGIPWLWALACLTILPLAVYVVSYIPWIELGNQWWTGFPAGHAGQTFLQLQQSMYEYHNGLRATHPASSPWWAWPLDLKPVWFYQGSFAGDTGASIYDAGNLVLSWLAMPAVAWAAWQAWRRRSLALTLIVVAAVAQWFSWSRIDRATFQYHVYAALPFAFMALAYFVAELWHGPARRTWALARVAAAITIMGPALLWLAKVPLCFVAGVSRVDASSQVCGSVADPVVVTQRVAMSVVILTVGAVATIWQWRLATREMAAARDADQAGEAQAGRLPPGSGWIALTVIATLFALVIAQARFPDTMLLSLGLGSLGTFFIALVVGAFLAVPAWFTLIARDPRRFAIGVVAAAALWFVFWYPDISALPLPGAIVNMYQGLLPTWIYDFQFAVNLDPVAQTPLISTGSLALTGMIALAVVAVMYATWSWRLELALRRADRAADDEPSGGPVPVSGS